MADGAKILVVDDSPATLEVVGRILRQSGHSVETAPDVPGAVGRLQGGPPDLVITDLRMPGADGLDLVRHVRENFPGTAVVMLTGFPSIEGAVEAVKGGAEAYLTKPFTQAELLDTVATVLQAFEGRRPQGQGTATALPLVGRSEAVRELRAAVEVGATGTNPVLIEAPVGSGGEAVARAIHDGSARSEFVFATIDCELLADPCRELFGSGNEASIVEGCDGGTLVLKGPEALDAAGQIHLMRLFQERRCFPVGGGRGRPVDVRVVALSARDLERQAGTGHLRRDLLERLSEQRIRLTALDSRKEDVVDLVHEIASRECALLGCAPAAWSDRALDALLEAPWPGDLAMLMSVVRGSVARVAGRAVEVADLPAPLRFDASVVAGEIPTLREFEAAHIRSVLEKVGGNKTEAARMLGIDRKTLRSKVES
ncbi:MAG: sigma-54 dependent transcriptional regulator [Acidobacteriota bacterium]